MTDRCCGPLTDQVESLRKRLVYWYMLTAYPETGRGPSIHETARDLLFRPEQIHSLLDALEADGALRMEPATRTVLEVYPYSNVPTRQRVLLENKTELYTPCAIDAFYVPFLTGSGVTIRSRCFHCRATIEVRVEDDAIATSQPASPVVWNSATPYDCPKTNFFCGQAHLHEWCQANPTERGELCTLAEALAAGKNAANRMMRSREGLQEVLWAKGSELVCYCREVSKATIVAAIRRGASTPEEIAKETTACTGGWCEETNPKKRCCCVDLTALLKAYSEKGPG